MNNTVLCGHNFKLNFSTLRTGKWRSSSSPFSLLDPSDITSVWGGGAAYVSPSLYFLLLFIWGESGGTKKEASFRDVCEKTSGCLGWFTTIAGQSRESQRVGGARTVEYSHDTHRFPKKDFFLVCILTSVFFLCMTYSRKQKVRQVCFFGLAVKGGGPDIFLCVWERERWVHVCVYCSLMSREYTTHTCTTFLFPPVL